MPPISKIIRSNRKTIALVVQPNGDLLVRAPQRATLKQIAALAAQHADWIAGKQAQVLAARAAFAPRQFVAGEKFPFLGGSYSLQLVNVESPVLDLNGSFQLARSALERAEQVFEQWYRRQARRVFTGRAGFYAGEYGFDYARVRISSARTRWGSCSPKGSLNFTWRLVMAPLEIVDYVVVHELSHLRERSHSKAFWTQVEAILPDYRARRKWLRENGGLFHWP